jgi:flagellar hook-length control protein FliK
MLIVMLGLRSKTSYPTKFVAKPSLEQRIAQGMNKATAPKPTQPANTKATDANAADNNKEADAVDMGAAADVKEIAGLSLEDLQAANNIKKLADKADADLAKVDTTLQQPVATDASVAALAVPVQANIAPIQTTHGVIAKEDVSAADTSKTAAISQALESDVTKNAHLSSKAQAELAKTDTGSSKADVSDWVESVLPNQNKQADAALVSSKLTAAANEIAAKSGSNNLVPNIAATTALNPLSAAQVASSNVINATPGKTGWDQAIGQKVVWMVGAGEQSATLTLNPPDLGPLQVVIHVHNNQADTTFISDNSDVRRALHDGLSNLKDMLGQSGINLGQANINSSQQEQQARQSSQSNMANNQSDLKAVAIDSKPTLVTRVSNGLVDTFA